MIDEAKLRAEFKPEAADMADFLIRKLKQNRVDNIEQFATIVGKVGTAEFADQIAEALGLTGQNHHLFVETLCVLTARQEIIKTKE
jgi:hypothetical protein